MSEAKPRFVGEAKRVTKWPVKWRCLNCGAENMDVAGEVGDEAFYCSSCFAQNVVEVKEAS